MFAALVKPDRRAATLGGEQGRLAEPAARAGTLFEERAAVFRSPPRAPPQERKPGERRPARPGGEEGRHHASAPALTRVWPAAGRVPAG